MKSRVQSLENPGKRIKNVAKLLFDFKSDSEDKPLTQTLNLWLSNFLEGTKIIFISKCEQTEDQFQLASQICIYKQITKVLTNLLQIAILFASKFIKMISLFSHNFHIECHWILRTSLGKSVSFAKLSFVVPESSFLTGSIDVFAVGIPNQIYSRV